jgi:enoyl-CoA hydratase/carnithine racemase
MADELLLQRDERVATLVFNRPEQRNALTLGMLAALRSHLTDLAADGTTRVVVLRGAGERAFSSGYDFATLQELREQGVQVSTPDDPFEQTMLALRGCPLPTIALIRGFAVGGGCALAAACDLRVAAQGARLGMPPAKLGLAYSDVGLRPFLELLGPARTRYLFYSGRLIGAAEAREIGLVDLVADETSVDEVALTLAGEIAANAPLSIRATKQVLGAMLDAAPLPPSARYDVREAVRRTLDSDDLEEGRRAYLEKRPPRFEGR